MGLEVPRHVPTAVWRVNVQHEERILVAKREEEPLDDAVKCLAVERIWLQCRWSGLLPPRPALLEETANVDNLEAPADAQDNDHPEPAQQPPRLRTGPLLLQGGPGDEDRGGGPGSKERPEEAQLAEEEVHRQREDVRDEAAKVERQLRHHRHHVSHLGVLVAGAHEGSPCTVGVQSGHGPQHTAATLWCPTPEGPDGRAAGAGRT
mmetsp:Transcript_90747/g.270869  ORF Transcript_90747/g.270869 Transcript_90747/m.270869 type:complete len:206 (+) Transcript_90747:2147-2764(+)